MQTSRHLSSVDRELLSIEVYVAGMGNFAFFCCCDLDLDLDLDLDPMTKDVPADERNEPSTSRLLKVIVLHTDRQTHRHTQRCHRNY